LQLEHKGDTKKAMQSVREGKPIHSGGRDGGAKIRREAVVRVQW